MSTARRWTAVPLAAATAMALAFAPAAQPAGPTLSGPAAHGVADTADTVVYGLDGDCTDTVVRAVLVTVQGEVEGAPAAGCEGSVAIPSEADLAELEDPIAPHAVRDLQLRTDDGATLDLTPARLQAQGLEVVAGDVEAVPSTDERGGGQVLAMSGTSATVALGTVDLAGVHSLLLRYATAADLFGYCTPSLNGDRCAVARATLTTGSPDGIPLASAELHATTGPDDFTQVVEPLLPTASDGAAELFLTVQSYVPFGVEDLLRLNWVDLNGRGVAEPYQPPADPEGTVTLFDGEDLEGWETSGLAHFTVQDGAMSPVGAYGVLWYAAQDFTDFTLRLEFRVSDTRANSGVFIRFDDPPIHDPQAVETSGYEIQVQDYGENYPGSRPESQTGAVYGLAAPERIATHGLGEWNHYEITAEGQQYTIRLNGRVVTEFTGDRRLDGHIGLQNHDPLFKIDYRNIRVLPHDNIRVLPHDNIRVTPHDTMGATPHDG